MKVAIIPARIGSKRIPKKNIKNFKIIIVDNAGNISLKKKIEEKFKIYKYIFLKIMEFYLEKISKEFKNIFPSIYTKKYLGDINCKGMGEILILK